MATSSQLIRDIVAKQSSAASVLQRFDIDVCVYGSESLQQACAELRLSLDQVLEKLSDAESLEDGANYSDLSSYTLHRLMQHIVRVHHSYLRRELPRLSSMASELVTKHGSHAPELLRIDEVLGSLRSEMLKHLQKEEQILFPYMVGIEDGLPKTGTAGERCFDSIDRPISILMREHSSAQVLVSELKQLSDDFTPPAWACAMHLALYAGLKQLEANLREHLQIENDLLFPRAIALESAGIMGD